MPPIYINRFRYSDSQKPHFIRKSVHEDAEPLCQKMAQKAFNFDSPGWVCEVMPDPQPDKQIKDYIQLLRVGYQDNIYHIDSGLRKEFFLTF